MDSFMCIGPVRNGKVSSPMVATGNQCCPSMRWRTVVNRGNRFSDFVLKCWGTARPCMRITEKSSWVAHRSEEHTSELQSHLNIVCRLLLEKKKTRPINQNSTHPQPREAKRRHGPRVTLRATRPFANHC